MQRIGKDVRREVRRFGPAGAIAEVVDAWPAAVGDAIARNAWPARVGSDGTLHVSTSSAAWAFELSQLAPTILERLAEAVGAHAPRAARFAVGRLAEPAPAPSGEATNAPPMPGERELAQARSLTAEIDDEELRNLVSRAAAASLARASSDRRF
jgi:hypothetical protein